MRKKRAGRRLQKRRRALEFFEVLFFMGEARGFHGTERSAWLVRYSVAVCP